MGFTTEQIKNTAITGHVGTGKTTPLEQILFAGGAIPKVETVESGKTNDLAAVLKNFIKDEYRTVIVLKDDDAMIKRAGNNIPTVSFLSYNRLRAHDLFYGQKIIMLENAAKNLSDFYNKEAK